jgi:hypothetical protein
VPVLIAGEPHGNLYLTGKQDGAEFTADHEEAVGLPAKFAGVASDHAQRSPGPGKAPGRTVGRAELLDGNADRRPLGVRAGSLTQ